MLGANAQHNSQSPYIGKPIQKLMWQFPDVTTWPAIGPSGLIYIGGGEKLYALRPDGTIKWGHRFEERIAGNTSPAIDAQGTVYASGGGNLYALNPNGTLKWKIANVSDYSPIIGRDGTVYTVSKHLYGIDRNGKIKWQSPNTFSECAPAIGPDGTIYGAVTSSWGGAGTVYALNPDGSSIKWQWSGLDGWDVLSLVVAPEGTIYVVTKGLFDHLYAISPEGEKLWDVEIFFNLPTTDFNGLSIGLDNTIYLTTHTIAFNDQQLFSWEWLSAEKQWQRWEFEKEGGVLAKEYRFGTPIIDPEGTIYVGTIGGLVYALNPDGSIKWQWYTQGVPTQYWLGDEQAKMIIGPGGNFYLVSLGTLYALGSELSEVKEIMTVDVDKSGKVDIADLALVGSYFGETGKNIKGDVNGDGVVDISDLVLTAKHFGEE